MAGTVVPDEIIVVNDHGTPELKKMLNELKMNTKVIYAYIKDDIAWNYTGSRNLALWLSRGEFISIEDNDHIPHKEYYEQTLQALRENPEASRTRTHKRWVVNVEDVLKNSPDKWKVLSSRPAHQDCCVYRRDAILKLKGYDERFAGAYGWSATDWRRRLLRAEIKNTNAGYQYVVFSEKTRGLSCRNYHLARRQDDFQSPHGIINFKYEYEQLSGS